MDRGAWWDTVHGVPKSRIPLNTFHFLTSLGLPDLANQVVGHPVILLGYSVPDSLYIYLNIFYFFN